MHYPKALNEFVAEKSMSLHHNVYRDQSAVLRRFQS